MTIVETDHLVCQVHHGSESEKSFELSPEQEVELIRGLKLARAAAKKAYAPYSKFGVGCTVLAQNMRCDNTMITGCNIENASYGATMCAERTAMFSSVAQGYRDFVWMVLSTINSASEPDLALRSPCGLCRQVMSEFFSPKTLIVMDGGVNSQEKDCIDIASIDTLLPWRFRL